MPFKLFVLALVVLVSAVGLVLATTSAGPDALIDEFHRRYPHDYRYDSLLEAITVRLQTTETLVFPSAGKTVTCFVYAGPLGCNAAAVSDQVVVIDSLLLETVDRLCTGVVYYGAIDNPLTRQLVHSIRHMPAGVPVDLRQPNPFGLPPKLPLSGRQSEVASRLLREAIAFALAHELSHCMLSHPVRLFNVGAVLSEHAPQGVFEQRGSLFLSSLMVSRYEKQADTKATEWVLRCGQGLDGTRVLLRFFHLLDGGAAPVSHPSPLQRLKTIDAFEHRFHFNTRRR